MVLQYYTAGYRARLQGFQFTSGSNRTGDSRWLRRVEEGGRLISRADSALREERDKDAESLARTLLAMGTHDLSAWYYLARALDGQGREKEACDAFGELLRDDPHRSSSRQNEPEILMRYAVLCFHNDRWPEGEAAARKGMAELNQWHRDTARKIPSLPILPWSSWRPYAEQIEAVSHLLSGKRFCDTGPVKAGLRELDKAIQGTSDEGIQVSAYWEKYNAFGYLQETDPAHRAFYVAEWKKAGQFIKLHDASLPTYGKPLTPIYTPEEFRSGRAAEHIRP